MTIRWYGLRGTRVVPLDSVEEWGRMMQSRDRIVKQTWVGNVFISTVFLGLDHSFYDQDTPGHAPVVFETMIFNGPRDQEMERYCTWDEALRSHHQLVTEVKDGMTPWELFWRSNYRRVSTLWGVFLRITRLGPLLRKYRRKKLLRLAMESLSSLLNARSGQEARKKESDSSKE